MTFMATGYPISSAAASASEGTGRDAPSLWVFRIFREKILASYSVRSAIERGHFDTSGRETLSHFSRSSRGGAASFGSGKGAADPGMKGRERSAALLSREEESLQGR
ncbi:hypothetical protein MASR1M66_08210 [Aminivibrio sp.]